MNDKQNRGRTHRCQRRAIGSAMAIVIVGALTGCGHEGNRWVGQDMEWFEKAFDESLIIHTAELPAAVVGKEYEFTINARGNPKPLRWRIVSGQLPNGMQLAADGALGGTPTTPEVATFVVKVVCKSQPKPSVYGASPHVYWRMRQFTLVVMDEAASSPGSPASVPKVDSARRQP